MLFIIVRYALTIFVAAVLLLPQTVSAAPDDNCNTILPQDWLARSLAYTAGVLGQNPTHSMNESNGSNPYTGWIMTTETVNGGSVSIPAGTYLVLNNTHQGNIYFDGSGTMENHGANVTWFYIPISNNDINTANAIQRTVSPYGNLATNVSCIGGAKANFYGGVNVTAELKKFPYQNTIVWTGATYDEPAAPPPPPPTPCQYDSSKLATDPTCTPPPPPPSNTDSPQDITPRDAKLIGVGVALYVTSLVLRPFVYKGHE